MNTLSEHERRGLEDVFLSISSNQPSIVKYKFSYYHACCILQVRKSFNPLFKRFSSSKKDQKEPKK